MSNCNDRRRGIDRRQAERRAGINMDYYLVERRTGFDRRGMTRRGEDRAEGRRRGFFREMQRGRVEQCIRDREKLKQQLAPYSRERMAKARKEALQLKNKLAKDESFAKDRLAKALALTYGFDMSTPAPIRLMHWQQESTINPNVRSRYFNASEVASKRVRNNKDPKFS